MKKQIKSKARIHKYGEVFTAQREVEAMLDLVKKESASIDSTFLEPACGTGNFLLEILCRKLNSVFALAHQNAVACEYWAIRTFSTIYGIDIMRDNITEARVRMYRYFVVQYSRQYGHWPSYICMKTLRLILRRNIQCGNTLTCLNTDNLPLIITQWVFDDCGGVTMRLYNYADMVESGCSCQPILVYPRTQFFSFRSFSNQKTMDTAVAQC